MLWSCQGGFDPAPIDPPPITAVLFNSHVSTCPVALLYQRMSLLPSPLKSPVSAIVQGLGAEPGEPPPITDVPFQSQITTCPLLPLSQRISIIPSPLKSRAAADHRGAVGEPSDNLAVHAVVPEDIAVAVAVEVVRVDERNAKPGRSIALPAEPRIKGLDRSVAEHVLPDRHPGI